MTTHHCTAYPCPTCYKSPWAWSKPMVETRILATTVTGTLTAELEFYTWREAVMQALDVASNFNTVGKPQVRWRYDRWLLSYAYRPVSMNGAVA